MTQCGPLSRSDSAALDGLRGLAALMVVASHASNLGMHLLPGVSLAGIGKYGVYLFFVLSAFLLTRQWMTAEQPSFPLLGHYLLRRVLRIYPLYALVLCIGWALPPKGLGVPLDGQAVWRHLALIEGRDIYWSVPVEFLYYLMIPPLGLLLASKQHAVVKFLVLVALAVACMVLFPPAASPLNSTQLAYYLPIFVCGSGATWAWQTGRLNAWVSRWGPRHFQYFRLPDLLALGLLLLAVPSVLEVLGLDIANDALHRSFLAWGLFWALLMLALLSGCLPWWRYVLQQSFFRACGRWCFGIYLLHMPALYLSRLLPIPAGLKAWLGLGLALVLAALAYRLVERPAIRLGARLSAAH